MAMNEYIASCAANLLLINHKVPVVYSSILLSIMFSVRIHNSEPRVHFHLSGRKPEKAWSTA